ncbi:MAG: zinc-ribbon domain-containing protein [Gammaproteobacteria bacterium]|nr:zinc-ribbon domain-containing protein [Gammaproteobacteria bacterium]MDH3415814.1 zinc-ribbon domain-containing protein [Gammaproteobacteria bacterium]
MYTQCPECDVAFRVTAEVLRQAAGKVRCGGCGIAFNALEHLSEEKPQPPTSKEPEPELPELTPEPPPELEADTPPRAISAEQSAALLKTLDQLAGSDIRIEDTGIEWRVLDTDSEAVPEPEAEPELVPEPELEDASEPAEETEADPVPETGSLKFFIEDESDQSEIVEEMRFDDNTPLPDDFDFEEVAVDAQEPEPGQLEEAKIVDELQGAQVDLAFGDADEWKDLLGDLDESEPEEEPEPEPDAAEAVEERIPTEADDLVAFASDQSDNSADQPLDMDTQFALQAEAMGIDLSGLHASLDDADPEIDVDKSATSIDEDLIAAAFETEEAARIAEEETAAEPESEIEDEAEEKLENEPEEELEDEFVDEIEDASAEDIGEEPEEELEYETIKADDVLEAALEDPGEEIEEEEHDEPDARDEPVIPEMTEDELTINMMIDQELLSVAVEDEDGFASTIVQKQPDRQVEVEIGGNKNIKKAKPLFETIVMEGESVRGDSVSDEAGREKLAPDAGVALRDRIRAAGNDQREYRETNWPSFGMSAGAIALLLMLGLQFMHQSREALATNPAFNSAVGPAYRALGKPLTPAWDISGWRFEQTKNSVDEADQLLTIYTRIGNKSDKALPYPLVHVSMTDRFEDIIGSRVLEPGVYLATNADPRKLVAPGNTFDAVISVESPSDEATGFKLNVCYRLASGDLGCATEDFK